MQPKGPPAFPSKPPAFPLAPGEDADSVADFDDADAGFEGPGTYQEKLLDAEFFNQFPDDFDEGDMEVQ